MILAAIDGQLLILLLMALFGFISWLSGKLNPGEKKQPQSPARPENVPKPRTAAESEEERMRRFLEALGLPGSEMPSPPITTRPKPVVVKAPPPIPARPRVAPRPVPPPPPLPAPRSLDELETTSLPPEQIALPELITSKIHEFETVTSTISATHDKVAPLREPSSPPPAASIHQLLRAALSSPQQLRSAFVLREILGPPPGLRS